MINQVEKKRISKQFSAIESSFRLEGLDPIEDPIYRAAKASVLRGCMTPEEALAYAVNETKTPTGRKVSR